MRNLAFLSILALGGSAQELFFPPRGTPSDAESDLVINSGDSFNVTWDTPWPKVNLRIRASAVGTNFTDYTSNLAVNLPSTGFNLWATVPKNFQLNVTDRPIEAYFLLSDQGDESNNIRSKNFTVEPPDSDLDFDGRPLNPSTHTGSVTLYPTGNKLVAATAAPTDGAVTAIIDTASIPEATQESDGDAQDTEGLDSAAKIGIGIGVAAGLLVFAGMISAAIVLMKRKRKTEASRSEFGTHLTAEDGPTRGMSVSDTRSEQPDPTERTRMWRAELESMTSGGPSRQMSQIHPRQEEIVELDTAEPTHMGQRR